MSLESFRHRALKFAEVRGESNHAEDFAQFASMRFDKVKPIVPRLDHLWVDYFRGVEGHLDSATHELRRSERYYSELSDQTYTQPMQEGRFNKIALPCNSHRDRILNAVLVLKYKWGLNWVEIAEVFNFSEKRAQQFHKEGLEIMRGLQ